MNDLCPHLAADKKVLLQGTLVEEPVLREGGDSTGVRRLRQHFVEQGKDTTLPKAVAAIYQFVCSTLHTNSMKCKIQEFVDNYNQVQSSNILVTNCKKTIYIPT